MRKYRVLLNGRNFWIRLDDEGPRRFGFYAWRYVEADTEDDAEHRAVQIIREESDLATAVLNERSDPPMIYADQIDELESFAGVEPPGKGRIWYVDTDPGDA